MTLNADLATWVLVWAAAAALLLLRHWRDREGVGLLLTYIVSLGVIHWLAAALYLLPWHSPRYREVVAEGMRQSGIAILALGTGTEVMTGLLRFSKARAASRRDARPIEANRIVEPQLVIRYLIAGGLLYGVASPLAGQLPSVQALAASGSAVIVMGLALRCWNGWVFADRSTIWRWLGVSSTLPFITVATQGFLGYGFAAMLTVFAFVASFFRPRWKFALLAVVLAYVGLSVYVTYTRDRNDIRNLVWGGANVSDRTTQLLNTFGNFEWFDPEDERHLERIDLRLNQDYLVGAAVSHLGRGAVPFANGSTFVDAALGIIPRALWPNKPAVGGSGNLVSTYTGIIFAEGTSVGIGQVMECYVNFGTAGVAVGFFIIGLIIRGVDYAAAQALAAGDVKRFSFWFLPGLAVLQVGGSLVEVTSTAAAGLLMAMLLGRVIAAASPAPAVRARATAAPAEPAQPGGYQ